MPVMTRIITDDSGSSLSVSATERSPEVIQLNACCAIARSSAGRPTSRATAATDTANDRMMAPHAIVPATPLLRRRPRLAFSTKPASGNSGISSRSSPLQAREGVWIERLAMAEETNHDGEPDRRLGGGDRHDEEHDDLSV